MHNIIALWGRIDLQGKNAINHVSPYTIDNKEIKIDLQR
jgi:hypothetical protein